MLTLLTFHLWPFNYASTGVASCGELGHVPPLLLTIYFWVNFRTAQSLTVTLCGCAASPNIFVFCDSSCGIVQSNGYMNLVQCVISRHFMYDEKFCSFVPPHGDATVCKFLVGYVACTFWVQYYCHDWRGYRVTSPVHQTCMVQFMVTLNWLLTSQR